MAGWRLERLPAALRRGVFAHGEMAEAVRKWRRRVRAGAGAVPPVSTLSKAVHISTAPTPLSVTAGHLWAVADCMPLDEAQVAAVLGVPAVWRAALLRLTGHDEVR